MTVTIFIIAAFEVGHMSKLGRLVSSRYSGEGWTKVCLTWMKSFGYDDKQSKGK